MHLDASEPDQRRRARCGWSFVDVETDISKVTCKVCLEMFRAGRTSAVARCGRQAGPSSVAGADLSTELAAAFSATLAPTAGPPPRVTPQLWAASCRGAEHRRCGGCELCAWEREASKWEAVRPWNRTHVERRPESAPRWPSLAAALVALAEWERHDRHGPSAMGGILRRIESGEIGDGGRSRPDDPLMHRAGELVRVRQALERAYPEGGHAGLTAGQCKGLLMARTAGVEVAVPSYEALSERLGVVEGELKALVRAGRRVLTEELGGRGLIPLVSGRRRTVVTTSVMRVHEERECA